MNAACQNNHQQVDAMKKLINNQSDHKSPPEELD